MVKQNQIILLIYIKQEICKRTWNELSMCKVEILMYKVTKSTVFLDILDDVVELLYI